MSSTLPTPAPSAQNASAAPALDASGRPVYENSRYWTQRLEREFTLAGVGHAGVGLAFNKWAYAVRRAVLLRTLNAHGVRVEGATLLELGFGTGFYLDLWTERKAAHVAGFDITEIAVRAARERYAKNWEFNQADIGAPLPLGEHAGKFDIATAFDVLFHLVEDANWNGALDNIARAVRPGGVALIFDKYQQRENAIGHVRRRTLKTYQEALEKRGFEILTVQPIFFLMNSPTDLSGLPKFIFKTTWSLTKLPYKLGKHVGLGEFFGSIGGALLYWPERALSRIFSSGPSTKLLIARKK